MSEDQIRKIQEAIDALTSAPTVEECQLVEKYDPSNVGFPKNLSPKTKKWMDYSDFEFAKPSKASLDFMSPADFVTYPDYVSVEDKESMVHADALKFLQNFLLHLLPKEMLEGVHFLRNPHATGDWRSWDKYREEGGGFDRHSKNDYRKFFGRGNKVSDLKRVHFPFHVGGVHFVGAIAYIGMGIVATFDSMGQSKEMFEIFRSVSSLLNHALLHDGGSTKTWRHVTFDVPQQTDGVNCGIFRTVNGVLLSIFDDPQDAKEYLLSQEKIEQVRSKLPGLILHHMPPKCSPTEIKTLYQVAKMQRKFREEERRKGNAEVLPEDEKGRIDMTDLVSSDDEETGKSAAEETSKKSDAVEMRGGGGAEPVAEETKTPAPVAEETKTPAAKTGASAASTKKPEAKCGGVDEETSKKPAAAKISGGGGVDKHTAEETRKKPAAKGASAAKRDPDPAATSSKKIHPNPYAKQASLIKKAPSKRMEKKASSNKVPSSMVPSNKATSKNATAAPPSKNAPPQSKANAPPLQSKASSKKKKLKSNFRPSVSFSSDMEAKRCLEARNRSNQGHLFEPIPFPTDESIKKCFSSKPATKDIREFKDTTSEFGRMFHKYCQHVLCLVDLSSHVWPTFGKDADDDSFRRIFANYFKDTLTQLLRANSILSNGRALVMKDEKNLAVHNIDLILQKDRHLELRIRYPTIISKQAKLGTKGSVGTWTNALHDTLDHMRRLLDSLRTPFCTFQVTRGILHVYCQLMSGQLEPFQRRIFDVKSEDLEEYKSSLPSHPQTYDFYAFRYEQLKTLMERFHDGGVTVPANLVAALDKQVQDSNEAIAEATAVMNEKRKKRRRIVESDTSESESEIETDVMKEDDNYAAVAVDAACAETEVSATKQNNMVKAEVSTAMQNNQNVQAYLDLVNKEVGNKTEIMKVWDELMRKFNRKEIDRKGFLNGVLKIFQGYDNLITGFNIFMPKGSKIVIVDSKPKVLHL